MTVGNALREAREQRGLSLRELSDRTNIRQSVLRAIEADDFTRLPGGVITRGFLKLFAREVGLEPDGIWQLYTEQAGALGLDRPGEEGSPAEQAPVAHAEIPAARPRSALIPVVGAVAALALATVGYLVLKPSPEAAAPAEQAAPPAPVEPDPPAAALEKAPAAPATAPPSVAAQATPASSEPSADVLRVELHATGPCWVSATADGAQVVYRQMNPGDRQAISVTREIELRVGMPGNLEVSLNGQPLPPPARPGTPATLRMTPANYRELLRQ